MQGFRVSSFQAMRFQHKAFLPSAFTFKRHGHDNWCGHVHRFKLQSKSFQTESIESNEALYPVVSLKVVVSNLDIALLLSAERWQLTAVDIVALPDTTGSRQSVSWKVHHHKVLTLINSRLRRQSVSFINFNYLYLLQRWIFFLGRSLTHKLKLSLCQQVLMLSHIILQRPWRVCLLMLLSILLHPWNSCCCHFLCILYCKFKVVHHVFCIHESYYVADSFIRDAADVVTYSIVSMKVVLLTPSCPLLSLHPWCC